MSFKPGMPKPVRGAAAKREPILEGDTVRQGIDPKQLYISIVTPGYYPPHQPFHLFSDLWPQSWSVTGAGRTGYRRSRT
ncbi:MAG: hypothetical protein ACR2RF_05640 [Geminicoccaceae bacterium]